MKLVELLARELAEWPEGFEDVGQADDGSLHLPGIGDHVRHTIEKYTKANDWFTAIITRAQWQAERDRQKGGEWKRHRGGDKPKSVSDGETVEVRLRSGDIQEAQADDFIWNHGDCDESANITKYRVISQPQAEEEVKDTNLGTLSYRVEIDTSPAIKALNELSAKWDQVESPFKWRDEVTELNAYIEEFTREREALINRLALEGFALLPAMHPVLGVAELDMSDWRNWKAGDTIKCMESDCPGIYAVGNYYKVKEVTEVYAVVSDDCGPNSHCHISGSDESVRFIVCP